MNKMFNTIYKNSTARRALAGAVALASIGAKADPVTDVFAAISLTTVATTVGALMVVVIGIAMAFKAADLGKRAVRKV